MMNFALKTRDLYQTIEGFCIENDRFCKDHNASYTAINASFVTAIVKGDSNNHWAIKWGDAQVIGLLELQRFRENCP